MKVRIKAQGLSYTYADGTCALSDIGLEVQKGEFVGVLGSNGSGKTTLLRILDGMVKDFSGSVTLDGEDVRKLTPRQIYSKVGLVFQNPDSQLFASTVYEDVAFGPMNMGMSESEVKSRVERALSDVDMEGLMEKAINGLSYGQKKRVAIAGLLAMGHEILLMDEPTAGLDPMGEYRMMGLLRELNDKQEVTVVMATHAVDLVPLFLDRLLILSRGKFVRQGAPEEVLCAPEEMEGVKLRLPHIAELIYKLKHEDKLPFDRVPVTIGGARREILQLMENKNVR